MVVRAPQARDLRFHLRAHEQITAAHEIIPVWLPNQISDSVAY